MLNRNAFSLDFHMHSFDDTDETLQWNIPVSDQTSQMELE